MGRPDRKKRSSAPLRERLEQEWSREMGFPLRVLMQTLVLVTFCCSMLVIGVHRLLAWLRRTLRKEF